MRGRILVADDDADNREIARHALERAGHDVVQARDGVEALEKAAEESPDVILLDLSMPRLNGWDAVKAMREDPRLADVPIVAFTAHALTGDDAKALGSGCDDYLMKPCSPREMVRKVEKWLLAAKGRRGGRSDAYCAHH